MLVAAGNDQIDLCAALLQRGDNIEVGSPDLEQSPLHHALMRGSIKAAKFLLAKGSKWPTDFDVFCCPAGHYLRRLQVNKEATAVDLEELHQLAKLARGARG